MRGASPATDQEAKLKQLDIDCLTKSYGTYLAIDAMSFSVAPGQIFGFVGSNGAGKTTTMRIVVGVLAADAGQVRWGGRPVTRQDLSRFGYMPEQRGLYPKMTVAKHLVYLGRLHGLSREQARQAMLHWTERLRIQDHRGKTVDSLSLGNQQRVQLAAALVHDPDLLVLDEPFSGLDPLAVDDMSAVMKETALRGAAVLFSSHQLDLVERLCDTVGIVRDGKLVACGALDELRDAPGTAQLYVEVDGAAVGWADQVPAVAACQSCGPGVLIDPAPGFDENAMLRAAMEHGVVREMAWRRPSLTELFRDLAVPHG
jgi:ABC-2 type transport system ATP-binding protein